jgi:hypothetical protein
MNALIVSFIIGLISKLLILLTLDSLYLNGKGLTTRLTKQKLIR